MFYLLGLLLLVALIIWRYQTSQMKKRAYFQRIDAYEHKRQEDILNRAKLMAAEQKAHAQHTSNSYIQSAAFKKTA
ncbi:hypothetical protein [Enterococcus pallens]|uniref:Uncharacterized protein n=1 Tax=Enterococcus pallens ATCC BAA-351 TaxID=1158607 RepID=R2QEJ1_9ENTE|nr:hypothetical protein [Enterococcus pallens]EOH93663.1 hypothetical protein UAU_02359 [Enterococcus pallens ATCC BAA-351]EOU24503.1 hypothetical protein I588_00490 [Enterococcus pallens ATCC BAA-351]